MGHVFHGICAVVLAGLLQTVHAATLPDAPPYVITILYDKRITEESVIDFETGQVVSRSSERRYTPPRFTFRSEDMDYFSLHGNRISLEWGTGWDVKTFRYDFGTRRGRLELGDNVTYADSYSFDGRSGSYWYETDDDPYFDRVYGKLRRVSVFITAPGDPIPVPAVPVAPSLPLLAAGLLALGALRRR